MLSPILSDVEHPRVVRGITIFLCAVLQAELLQSQGEVRMLLDRVSESSRDRAEMVSSKVHTQLMAIADEKVVASERRGQMLEREVSSIVCV